MNQAENEMTKVIIPLPPDSPVMKSESIWAKQLGVGLYKICNIPFYAYNISLGDTVYAEQKDPHSLPILKHVVKKSGNRTLRILFENDLHDSIIQKDILEALITLGCGCERLDKHYVTVNVPLGIDASAVEQYLQDRTLNWEAADPQTDS